MRQRLALAGTILMLFAGSWAAQATPPQGAGAADSGDGLLLLAFSGLCALIVLAFAIPSCIRARRLLMQVAAQRRGEIVAGEGWSR